jgi:hypothetical protein
MFEEMLAVDIDARVVCEGKPVGDVPEKVCAGLRFQVEICPARERLVATTNVDFQGLWSGTEPSLSRSETIGFGTAGAKCGSAPAYTGEDSEGRISGRHIFYDCTGQRPFRLEFLARKNL